MAMKRCPDCGEKYSDTYKYCPFCEEEEVLRKGKDRGRPAGPAEPSFQRADADTGGADPDHGGDFAFPAAG